MKNSIAILIVCLLNSNLVFSQSKNESEKDEGRYQSLAKALKEPEKVIYYDADRSRNIPSSVSVFKNLQKLTLFLDNNDSLPNGIKELKNLKQIVIFSEATIDWQNHLCGMDSLERFLLFAPISEADISTLKNCIRAGNKQISSSASVRKKLFKEKTNFNNVDESIKSTSSTKTLFLMENVKEINRISEIKNLNKFYFYSDRKREYDFTACSGSSTLIIFHALFSGDGRIHGLDVGKFPNLEELWLTVPFSANMKELPTGIEKLKMLKKLSLFGVRLSEENVEQLKKSLPDSKITLNDIVVQNPK